MSTQPPGRRLTFQAHVRAALGQQPQRRHLAADGGCVDGPHLLPGDARVDAAPQFQQGLREGARSDVHLLCVLGVV